MKIETKNTQVSKNHVVVQGFVNKKLIYTSKRIDTRKNNAAYRATLARRWTKRIEKQISSGRKI